MNEVIVKNFRQKDLCIKRISLEYKKVKYLRDNSLMICEDGVSSGKTIKYYQDLKVKYEYILLQMGEDLSRVIYNEYLLGNNKEWWIFYYSKSTYYRMKHKAIDLFLEWWYA